MQNDRFDVPVTVTFGSPATQKVLRTPLELQEFLMNNWSGKKSPKHRAAIQACHDALAGDKPAMVARRAFLAAAREIDVVISDKP
jgi:hypothetical protein